MKKLMMLVLSMMLVFGTASAVFAADKDPVFSPTGSPTTEEGKKPEAPKTGESNAVIYAVACALVLSGCAVVAKKRLEA